MAGSRFDSSYDPAFDVRAAATSPEADMQEEVFVVAARSAEEAREDREAAREENREEAARRAAGEDREAAREENRDEHSEKAARDADREDHARAAREDPVAADREASREEHREEAARRAAGEDREAAREEHRDHDGAARDDRPVLTPNTDVQDADPERHGSVGDSHYQDIADLDTQVTVGADTSLHLDPGMVGAGAAGANAVFEPITESSPHSTIGADLTLDPDDPAFDLRVAEISQAATVQQEAADAADGGTTNVATPEGDPSDGEHPGALEHAGNDLVAATESAALAAATVAFAPAVAVVAAGEELLETGKDLAHAAGDAAEWTEGAVSDGLDEIFGGGDEHPGQSTFATDGDTSFDDSAEERAAALAARQAEVDEAERLRAIHDGAKAGNVEDAPVDHFSVFHDEHHELVGDLDDQVAAGAMTGSGLIDVQADLAGTGASGALGAPDNVMVPVDELRDHVGIGADPSLDLPPGLAGPGAAADPVVMVPVDELRDHVGIGADPSVDLPPGLAGPGAAADPVVMDTHGDTSVKLDPGMVGPGAAGGNAMDAPDGALETVAGLSPEVAIGADPVIAVGQLPTADHAPADVAFGADVQLNPQPIPPGMGADLGSPVAETVMGDLSFGSDVQLNPQPIPPGMGADVQLNVQPEDRTGMGADKVPADYAPDDHSGLSAPKVPADYAPDDHSGLSAPKVPADYAPDDHSGLSADKGEPAADAAVHQALSVDDSSIIIVGGAEAAIDVNEPPTADNAPVPIALGADVQLNPQPIPPGIGADIGEPAADVAVDHAPSGDDSSIIIVGGEEAPLLADHAPADAALGADVQLNPQPIPPGMDLHPPSPIMGADIGEPAADVAVDQAPSGDDSSIIIVGGDESPMLSDDLDTSFAGAEDIAVDAAPMEQDIASTLAADTDGPAFQAVDIDEAPIDVGITENDFDS